MTSQLDQAQTFEERDREAAVCRVRHSPAVHSDWLVCANCEDDIPAGRRAALPGTRLCISCAMENER
jgi:phage/conjugal plasmid C-4 type zinc finger TraR family protein